jgi:hypothetical protein
MVEGVEEDEGGGLGVNFGQHVDAGEACETKGGGLE